MTWREYLREIPKVELHCHFLGSARPETLSELAKKNDVPLEIDPVRLYERISSPVPSSPGLAGSAAGPAETEQDSQSSTYSLLDASRMLIPVLVEEADFARIAYESSEDAVQTSNIRYRELFFEVSHYLRRGLSYRTVVDGLIAGIRAAEKDFGIVVRLIGGLDRSCPSNEVYDAVRAMVDNPRDEVIGIGLEDLETLGPPEKFVDAYRLAKSAGLHRTAHAGEHAPTAEHVITCLDLLECERIDHGYFLLTDSAAVDRCVAGGTYFTCISTTSRHPWQAWRRESIRAMVRRGLRVSLASDDPAMFPTTLTREYEIAVNEVGLHHGEIKQIAQNGIHASWMNDDEKARMSAEFDRQFRILDAKSDLPDTATT